MIIKINNTVVNDATLLVSGQDASISIKGDYSLTQLDSLFPVGQTSIIEEYNENGALNSKWYAKEPEQISFNKQADSWVVHVSLKVSALSVDNKDELLNAIDVSEGGLVEVAGLVDNMVTSINTIQKAETSRMEDMNNWKNDRDSRIADFNIELQKFEARLNRLADRIATLENK